MKKIILSLTLSLLLGIISCDTKTNQSEINKSETKQSETKQSETKVESNENKATVNTVDTSSVKKSYTKADPDTTDNIPTEKYGTNSSSIAIAGLIRTTLLKQFKADLAKNLIDEKSRKFIYYEYDLNDDGKTEYLVGFTGLYFCGSGGCTQYILDNKGNVISKFSVSDYPVIIDINKSNGWKDLIMSSGGKNHVMKYNGKTYPPNPSLLPEFDIPPGDNLPRALNYEKEPYPWFKF